MGPCESCEATAPLIQCIVCNMCVCADCAAVSDHDCARADDFDWPPA